MCFTFQISKIIEQLVNAATNLEITNPSTLEMALSTLDVIATTSGDMSILAQHKLSDFIRNINKNFQEISRTSSKKDSLAAGKMVLPTFLKIISVSLKI